MSSPAAAEAAYKSNLEEINAIAASELAALNVDLPTAASLAMTVAARTQHFVEVAAKQLPHFPVGYLVRLADYARAAWFAYLMNKSRVDPSELPRLLEKATALRTKMLLWAEPLAHSGFFDARAVAAVRAAAGSNKDIAGDLVALAAMYSAQRLLIAGKCDVSGAEITQARELGLRLFAALGRRVRAVDRRTRCASRRP